CRRCAMALLHSRVRRVFVLRRQATGALGSWHSLHVLSQLNHRLQVFLVLPSNGSLNLHVPPLADSVAV
ncbi:MAG: hypothetical protein MHM6MM_008543, partial [Cercozoa sp. M6MM]